MGGPLHFYTIGHSNHTRQHFEELLRQHGISAVADVRSQPYSRYAVDFNREVMARWLPEGDVAYVFLGDLLGGRPSDRRFYDAEGHVLYAEMARSEDFLAGIGRLEEGANDHTIAVMCGEENPAQCHRHLLVSRVLLDRGHQVTHIRGDGTTQSADSLFASSEPRQMDMFSQEEPAPWRSTQSVSPSEPRNSSSDH